MSAVCVAHIYATTNVLSIVVVSNIRSPRYSASRKLPSRHTSTTRYRMDCSSAQLASTMAIVSRPATLLSIPKELRLMIWERVFPELQYFGGVHEYGCLPDVSRSQFVRLYGNDPEAAPSCFCNYYRLQPLFICKQTYDGMKYVLDKADIHADFTSTIPRGLRPSLYKRIRALTLSESVFPVLSCQLGFLEHVRYDDFLSTFPSLEKITMPSHELGWSMDLRFPSSIPFHIDGCLNSRDGPASMPTANMMSVHSKTSICIPRFSLVSIVSI